MAIKSHQVNHPERDLTLTDRESGNGAGAADVLDGLAKRIAAAKAVIPGPADMRYTCCLACYKKGRDAAIRIIEEGGLP